MKKVSQADTSRMVFLNCPFDDEYLPLLRAAAFTVKACGFEIRCALETADGGEVRISKILRLIGECRFGIHDISRTSLDQDNNLPRFNMPLELGLFLGASHFGNAAQRLKQTLVLDVERYRYQKFLSDIAGQDIKAHANLPEKIICVIRDWLNTLTQKGQPLPGGKSLGSRYQRFQKDLPPMLKAFSLHENEVSFVDMKRLIHDWLAKDEEDFC